MGVGEINDTEPRHALPANGRGPQQWQFSQTYQNSLSSGSLWTIYFTQKGWDHRNTVEHEEIVVTIAVMIKTILGKLSYLQFLVACT